jgi:hypothetical protein
MLIKTLKAVARLGFLVCNVLAIYCIPDYAKASFFAILSLTYWVIAESIKD